MVVGHARHGKDTVAELLMERGYTFISSSMAAAERVVLPYLKAKGIHYDSVEDCFQDRGNHRAEWYNAITGYNTPDKARLGREIYKDYDVYCGLRNSREFHALRNEGAFDVSIFVDASERLPLEDKSSMGIEPWMADYVLDNNGTLEELIPLFFNLITTIERKAGHTCR